SASESMSSPSKSCRPAAKREHGMMRRALALLGLPAVLFAVWWFASAGSTDFYRPPLARILVAFKETWFSRRLLDDVAPSLARQALSIGIILMVISEMFAASSGLGFTVVQFQRGFEIPEMWSGVLLLGLIGVLLSLAFRLVDTRILKWYHGERDARR